MSHPSKLLLVSVSLFSAVFGLFCLSDLIMDGTRSHPTMGESLNSWDDLGQDELSFVMDLEDSFFCLWLLMELNSLAFVSLLTSSPMSMIKYFLIQSVSSVFLLFTLSSGECQVQYSLTNSMLLVKMGASPFHWWVPQVYKSAPWNLIVLLSTQQKILPITALSLLEQGPDWANLCAAVAAVSTLVGALGAWSQTSMRGVIGYSSVSHTGWLLLSVEMNLLLSYFLVYTIGMIIICKSCSVPFNELSLFVGLLSLAGMPPLVGFFPKWLIIMEYFSASRSPLLLWAGIILLSTMISLAFYLALALTMLLKAREPYKCMSAVSLLLGGVMFLI